MQTAIVVGAGVAGLQACRALIKRRFNVIVLEQGTTVGGVWSKNYQGYAVQVPRELYEFAEFPWPDELGSDNTNPTGQEVLAYVEAYVRHFGLQRYIRYQCNVIRIDKGPYGWSVTFTDSKRGGQEALGADYVVISTGLYSQPRIPPIAGRDVFQGLHIHAKDFTDAAVATGKRVVVIGAGKTALDCAGELVMSRAAVSVTWLFRQVHWPLPSQVVKGLSIQNLLFSKLSSLLVKPYYTAGPLRRATCAMLSPAQNFLWRSFEKSIKEQFQLAGLLEPSDRLREDLLYSGQIVDTTWIQLISKHALGDKRRTQQGDDKTSFCGLKAGWWRGSSTAAAPPGRTLATAFTKGSRNGRQQPPQSPRQQQVAAPSSVPSSPRGQSSSGDLRTLSPGVSIPRQRNARGADAQRAAQRGAFVVPVQGRVSRFTSQGLLLTNGQHLPADLVLYCTGYVKTYDYLPGTIKARLGLQTDGLHLYRSVLPPQVPGLAFVGSEVSTFNNILTSGLQAEWLAAHWSGKCKLPSAEVMQTDVQLQQEWRRRLMPEQRNRGTVYQMYMYEYHAQLVTDMGVKPPRRSMLQPLTAQDYGRVFIPPAESLYRTNSKWSGSMTSSAGQRPPSAKAAEMQLPFYIGPPDAQQQQYMPAARVSSPSAAAASGGSSSSSGWRPPAVLTRPATDSAGTPADAEALGYFSPSRAPGTPRRSRPAAEMPAPSRMCFEMPRSPSSSRVTTVPTAPVTAALVVRDPEPVSELAGQQQQQPQDGNTAGAGAGAAATTSHLNAGLTAGPAAAEYVEVEIIQGSSERSDNGAPIKADAKTTGSGPTGQCA